MTRTTVIRATILGVAVALTAGFVTVAGAVLSAPASTHVGLIDPACATTDPVRYPCPAVRP